MKKFLSIYFRTAFSKKWMPINVGCSIVSSLLKSRYDQLGEQLARSPLDVEIAKQREIVMKMRFGMALVNLTVLLTFWSTMIKKYRNS